VSESPGEPLRDAHGWLRRGSPPATRSPASRALLRIVAGNEPRYGRRDTHAERPYGWSKPALKESLSGAAPNQIWKYAAAKSAPSTQPFERPLMESSVPRPGM
jgi:hypothetical protein